MSKPKAPESFMVEVLAFGLYVRSCYTPEALLKGISDAELEKLRAAWRTEEDIRVAQRTLALNFIQDLEEGGVAVAIKRSEKLRKAVDRIVTVPSHRAYDLGDA